MARRALLIGVGDYRWLPTLPAASSGVADLAEVLRNPLVGGYDAHQIRDTASNAISREIEDFFSSAIQNDQLFVYFACHGFVHNEKRYLAAADTDPHRIRETAISTEAILNLANRSRAASILIILDTCGSSEANPVNLTEVGALSTSSKVAVICSSRDIDLYAGPSQNKTFIMGVLTDGLSKGNADANHDGIVGIQELYAYLSDRFGFEDPRHPGSLKMSLVGPDFAVTASPRRPAVKELSSPTLPNVRVLRPYQADAVLAIEAAVSARRGQIVIELAPGTGKSVVIAVAIYRLMESNIVNRVLYLTDRVLQKQQMQHVLSSMEIEDGLTVGGRWSLVDDPESLVSALSSQSKNSRLKRTIELSTMQQLHGIMNSLGTRVDPDAFDLLISEIGFPANALGVWKETLAYFNAQKIFFSAKVNSQLLEKADDLIFRYSVPNAINDGTLVDPATANLQAWANAWPEFNRSEYTRNRRVFISYALEDFERAKEIASQLNDAGVSVWCPDPKEHRGRDLIGNALAEIESHDAFVILLSPAALNSHLVREELEATLERRAVDVIPAMIRYCAVPRSLADRTVVDVRHGIDALLRRLQAGTRIDFDSLDADIFEKLIRELLTRLDFRVDETPVWPDAGYDFRGTFRDPLGLPDSTTYLVDVNFAGSKRTSVLTVKELAGIASYFSETRGAARGLLVTSGHLTSVARKVATDINRQTIWIHIIDGPQLKSLLLMHPDLISQFFPDR